MDNENITTNAIIENNNGEVILMAAWGYHLASVVLLFIGIFGFTLNLFVIILMCKDVQLWTPMNIILLNLVCSDFSVSIFGNPLTLTAAIHKKWIFGREMCIAYGFFMALLGIASITTLTVLAYERYCMITYPLSSKTINKQGAVILIGFIWIYSLILTTPPLFGWGAYVNEAANISCSVNWESKTYNATSYIVFLFIFGLVLPVFVISYSYIKIVHTMKQNASRLGRISPAEGRVTWMVATMILAFLIAWGPYATFALIEQFGPHDLISPAMAVLPALIAKSSICYNPLIYVGLNTQFRTSWKRQTKKESTIIETSTHQIITHPNDSLNLCTTKIIQNSKGKFSKLLRNKSNDNDSDEQINNKSSSNILQDKQNIKDKIKIENSNMKNEKNDIEINLDQELTVFNEGKLKIIRKNIG